MKIKNTSRIIAFALVVMMIVPLIGVPAFAGEYEVEAPSAYYNNDFESYILDAKTEEGDDPDGDPNAHVVGVDDYFAGNPNPDADQVNNTVVANPDGTGQVFKVQLNETNKNNNGIVAKVEEISYKNVNYVLVEQDLYIPADATGEIQWQYGNNYDTWTPMFYICMEPETTDGDNVTPGRAYIHNSMRLNPMATFDDKLELSRGKWHTISYLMNLSSGLFNLRVDGEFAAAGIVGKTNTDIILTADAFRFAKLATETPYHTGSVYVDNISVTASEIAPTRPPLYENDFEGITLGDATEVKLEDATTGIRNISAGDNYAVKDPKDDNNIVWKSSMGKNSENKAYNFNVSPTWATYPDLLIEWKMYVSADATGRIQFQYVARANKGATATKWYQYINFNATTSKFEPGTGYMATVGNLELTRETWHSIAFAQNLVTGDFSLYIDNAFVAFGSLNASGLVITDGSLYFGKVQKNYTGNGYLMYDDIKVGEGVKPEGATGGVDTFEPEWYEQNFEEFEDGANISDLFPHRKAFSGAYEDYFVADVDGNKAWKREMNPAFNDAWSYLATPIASHQFVEKIVIESSYYLPTGATGYFVAQAYGANTGPDGNPGGAWMSLYAVDVTNGKLLADKTTDLFEVVNEEATTLARDTWIDFTYVINLVYGNFDLFVDGEYTATGQLANGLSKITFSEGYIDVCNAKNLTVAEYAPEAGSCVYVDNVSVTAYADQVVDYINIKEDLVSATINGEELVLGNKYLIGDDDVYEEVLFDRAKYTATLGDITAEIRLCTDDGFRFKTEIDKDVLAEMAEEEYNAGENGLVMGTIIIPADYLEDPSALSFKLLNDLGKVEGKDYLNVVAKDCYEDADGTYIAGSILNLQEWNYARDFVAVSYVQMTLPMGNTSTVYGAVCEPASAAWTAFEVYDSAVEGDFLPEEMAILEKFQAAAK